MRDGFIKAAAATPQVRVADCEFNSGSILALIRQAEAEGVKLLALPELCLTAYTCGDLFFNDVLLRAAEDSLRELLDKTAAVDMLFALGLPVKHQGKLYNCAAVCCRGVLLGLVPKTCLPAYGEFYETRWFTPGKRELTDLAFAGQDTVFGTGMVFSCETVEGLGVGVEICEDLWSVTPSSSELAAAGATVILNLSASNELVTKDGYRRALVLGQSARLVCGYVYADAGEGESTTDLVFAGHNIIAENGELLAQSRFRTGLAVSEIDVKRLCFERRRINTFPEVGGSRIFSLPFRLEVEETAFSRPILPMPFVPTGEAEQYQRAEDILTIAALGLKKRMEHIGAKRLVLGVSGGLDSTLAALICVRALDMLGLPRSSLLAVTMPCLGTTARTKSNAEILAEQLGAEFRTVDITNSVRRHFADIGHDEACLNVVFENAQARERTQVLMDIANGLGAILVGTGDMSELALGWATYNGDHMSMYGVNAGIPKTLVRYLVAHCADIADAAPLAASLRDVLATPVSPELLPASEGDISQRTEDLVGPYELHDFFLYYLIRWGCEPKKVLRMAEYAFKGEYDRDAIKKWLKTFVKRFFAQQFKRSCLPDGPKVGTLSLSPRGDWRMPSDAVCSLWLKELEN